MMLIARWCWSMCGYCIIELHGAATYFEGVSGDIARFAASGA